MTGPYCRLCLVISVLTSAAGFISFIYWTSHTDFILRVKPSYMPTSGHVNDSSDSFQTRLHDAYLVADDTTSANTDDSDEEGPYLADTENENPDTESTDKDIPDEESSYIDDSETENTYSNSRTQIENVGVIADKANSLTHNIPDSEGILNDQYSEVEQLTHVLYTKLQRCTVKKVRFKPTCSSKRFRGNSCQDSSHCLRTELPDQPSDRVAQLVTPRRLRMTSEQHEALRFMRNQLLGNYDVIILTAASSNHYYESQALLKNLHENVFPYLKNFTLVFYDIGLTPEERSSMVKFCKCKVLDFPFDKFPDFMKNLRCYSWKPVIIKSQLMNANIVIWADASVRFLKGKIDDFVEKTRQYGVQIGAGYSCSSLRTARSMYHFFGDEPCAYACLGQARATVGAFHREVFVDKAILEPWVACAMQTDCMCPSQLPATGCSRAKKIESQLATSKDMIMYGQCHRFDQSAISLILHKLYQDSYRQVLVNNHPFSQISRRHTEHYFPKD